MNETVLGGIEMMRTLDDAGTTPRPADQP